MLKVINNNKNYANDCGGAVSVVTPCNEVPNTVRVITPVAGSGTIASIMPGKTDGIVMIPSDILHLKTSEASVCIETNSGNTGAVRRMPQKSTRSKVQVSDTVHSTCDMSGAQAVRLNKVFTPVNGPCVFARVQVRALVELIQSSGLDLAAHHGSVCDIVLPVSAIPTIDQAGIQQFLELLPSQEDVLVGVNSSLRFPLDRMQKYAVATVDDSGNVAVGTRAYEPNQIKGMSLCQAFVDDTPEELAARIHMAMQDNIRSLNMVPAKQMYIMPVYHDSSVMSLATVKVSNISAMLTRLNTALVRILKGLGIGVNEDKADEDQPF